MKKLTFTLVLGILLLNVSAFGRISELNIRLHDYAMFNVVFDKQVVNTNANNYDFYSITPGYHYMKIIENPAPIRGNRGYYNQNPRVIFSGNIYIGPNRKVFAMIDAFNRFVVIREEIFIENRPDENNKWKHNQKGNDNYGYNSHNNKNDNNYGYNSHDNNYGNNNYSAMSPNDFNALKITIANAKFESTKFSIAKSAISLNRLTSSQVFDLLYLFTYESTKLDFAKLAYYSVIDKERFFIVYDTFTFSNSVDELSRYISR